MEATVDPCPGVPIGCRSPRKRGPYSTPKNTKLIADVERLAAAQRLDDVRRLLSDVVGRSPANRARCVVFG
jgi:hypothetical protein